MKRLQFRHNKEVFQNRTDVLKYFADIVDVTKTASTIFNSSLYAEPLVAKYLDEDGNQQIILAIGVDSGLTPYHIIDSKEIAERLDAEKEAIEAEVERAKDAEKSLSGSIETEIARAMEAELFLSGAVDTERTERIAADAALQTQITENIAKIVPVTENLGANVREEYVLKNAKGEELGSHIKVYKDSALVGAEVNYKGATGVTINDEGKFEFNYTGEADKSVEYLYLIYRNEEGGLSLVALDFENFLMENEEGLGIKIVDHKITINIKAGDKYLKVSEDGLQTINIDEAIKTSVDTLSEEINAKVDAEIERSTAADEYISGLTAEFSAATVSEFILVNSALTIETERAIAAELSLSGAIDTERAERINKDKEIDSEISGIKAFNNTLNNKVDVEITRSINEDENFRLHLDHLSADINTEISNRELANESIRAEFAAGDAALGSRIDTEAEIRSAADNALSERVDDEAEIRRADDALLTSTINGVSERLAAVEADYLVYQDKADVLLAVSGAHNTAIEAVNAAASAQTTADEAKAKIEGFMAAAEIGGAAIDTLIEIQNYIKSDGTAASEMLDAIAENKSAIAAESERAKGAEKTLDDNIKAETSARVEAINILSGALTTEITRAMGAESVNATSIANEVTRATNVESSLQTALTTEINNRESADNAIRGDFAAADESLKTRIAAEELARQTSYDALNTRIDNEATNRASAVAALTTEITNGDKAVRESYEAADAVLQQAIQAETQNREAADVALQQAIQAETKNREDADATLLSAIQAETKNREDADTNLVNQINQEVSARTQDVLSINTKLTALEGVDASLDTKVNTLSASILTEINTVKNAVMGEITSAFTIDDAKVLEASKIYADDAVKVAVDDINAKKVNDVSYDNGNKKIYLTFADGTLSNGFDASEFVVDGMLSGVTFDNNANTIKFVWNTTAGIEEIIVPLDKFVDQYAVSVDSVSFLKISDDNQISAIVDNADGFINTLASTNYVQSIVEGAQQILSSNTYNALIVEREYVNAASGNIETTLISKTDALNNALIAEREYVNTVSGKIETTLITKTDALNNALIAEREYVNTVSGKIETTLITKTDALNNALSAVSSNVNIISGSVKELSGSVVNTVSAHTADINRLSGDVVSYVNTTTSGISYNVNLLSGNTFAAITALTESTSKGLADLSGNVLTYVNNEDTKIISAITKNEAAIAVLNADKKTEGSVLYRIENEFEKSLITDGVPVTAVSPEEANKVHSLIRQITVNGEMRYYAMSDATEMFYVKPRATETAPIETVNLNDYITTLKTENINLDARVKVLEEKLNGFAGNMEQTMKDLIKSYLVGTENEIKITETDDKLTIGFDDNAIFGEI